MRAESFLAALLVSPLASVALAAGESALDQLKAYTESRASSGKAPVRVGPPDIAGIRLGMPLRDAFAGLQAKYPAQKLATEAVRLPPIEKPVLSRFSTGLSPAQSAEEWITVDVTPPPSPQAVWRVQRHLGRQRIPRIALFASLREKYGKESAELADDIADDQHATDLWWFYDTQWNVTRPGVRNANADITGCARWTASVSWFAANNVVSSASDLSEDNWCNTRTTLVHVHIAQDEILSSLMIEMYSIPLAVRSAKAELAWLSNQTRGVGK